MNGSTVTCWVTFSLNIGCDTRGHDAYSYRICLASFHSRDPVIATEVLGCSTCWPVRSLAVCAQAQHYFIEKYLQEALP